MTTKPTLLASAPSLEQISEAVKDFYCGEGKNLIPQENATWAIASQISGKVHPGVYVIKRGKRYRFEMI